jgi:hypothetical protein
VISIGGNDIAMAPSLCTVFFARPISLSLRFLLRRPQTHTPSSLVPVRSMSSRRSACARARAVGTNDAHLHPHAVVLAVPLPPGSALLLVPLR